MSEHEPRARYCTEIVGIPTSELRDDLTCPACDEQIKAMMLDPGVEVLAPPAHLAHLCPPPAHLCPECKAGKHGNCDGTAWDDHADTLTTCTCTHEASG